MVEKATYSLKLHILFIFGVGRTFPKGYTEASAKIVVRSFSFAAGHLEEGAGILNLKTCG
jgi:hypothetical protein